MIHSRQAKSLLLFASRKFWPWPQSDQPLRGVGAVADDAGAGQEGNSSSFNIHRLPSPTALKRGWLRRSAAKERGSSSTAPSLLSSAVVAWRCH